MVATKLVNMLELEEKLYATHPRLNDAEFNKLVFDTEICVKEHNVIHAFAIYSALERLESENLERAVRELTKDLEYYGKFGWAATWKDEFNKESRIQGKTKIEYAIKHLQKVVDYHRVHYNSVYNSAWLMDFDEVIYQHYKEKFGKGGYNNGGNRTGSYTY